MLAALLINPRSFDAGLSKQADAAKGAEKPFLNEFRRWWQAFDSIGIYIDADRHFELGAAIQVRSESLPKAAQRLFADFGKPSALWDIIPQAPLFALAARIDISSFADAFAPFLDLSVRAEIERSLETGLRPFFAEHARPSTILNGLGPDWGFWMAMPSGKETSWIPQAILALKVKETSEGASAEATIRNAVQFLSALAQLSGKGSVRVETVEDNKTSIKALVNESFPANFRPSFASKDGFLLLADSPSTVKQFAMPGEKRSFEETPILRLSAIAWKNYLGAHKTEVASFLAKRTERPVTTIVQQIDELCSNLNAIDRVEVVISGKRESATLTMRLKMVQPK